jgi:hypothetical protein
MSLLFEKDVNFINNFIEFLKKIFFLKVIIPAKYQYIMRKFHSKKMFLLSNDSDNNARYNFD